MLRRQQRRIPTRRRRIHRHRLLGAETVQVVRPTRFGASTAQTFTTKRLHTHHRANHVAVDVNVADMRRMGQRLGSGVNAGLDAQREAIAQRVDLRDDVAGLARPAHHLQHRAEDLGFYVSNACHLKGVRSDQICY